jgi:hypothetical protein
MTVSVNALPVDSVDLKIKDPFELAAEGNQTSAAGSQKLVNRRAELNEHSNEVNVILRDLEEDVDDLRVQEAWDGPTAAGAHDWATDRGMVFRALRVGPWRFHGGAYQGDQD